MRCYKKRTTKLIQIRLTSEEYEESLEFLRNKNITRREVWLNLLRNEENKPKKTGIAKSITKSIAKLEAQHSEVAGVQEVMNAFYEINPGLNFGNKTQRAAAEWLVKKYTLEKTLAMITYAASIHSEQYAPVITTPTELKNNLGKLIAFSKKPKKGFQTI